MAKVGIIFGSNEGATKEVAEIIAGNFDSEVVDAKVLEESFFTKFDKFIFVASTHGHGLLQKDFKAKLDLVEKADFTGKTIALCGIGGQVKHPTTFLDGLVEFLPLIRGAKLVGASEVNGYKFEHSLALINGKFVGGCIDVQNDANWKARLNTWIDSIKKDF